MFNAASINITQLDTVQTPPFALWDIHYFGVFPDANLLYLTLPDIPESGEELCPFGSEPMPNSL